MTPSQDITRLIEIMAALRTPVTGCPWDLEQTFATIAPYTIEEAYEVADAIARGDLVDLKDELGDLLLQVAYHARMAEEEGAFAFGDVVEAITAKMIRRHPHVFGDAEQRAAGAAPGFWAKIKAEERAAKAAAHAKSPSPHASWGEGWGEGQNPGDAQTHAPHVSAEPSFVRTPLPVGRRGEGLLADGSLALPARTRAVKLQDKAARVGFDWPSLAPVFDKMREELSELEHVALPA
ncbi:MAG: nucleoside triphosphate pyrophosphohydrolase, partial [Hyphomicrobium sp.]